MKFFHRHLLLPLFSTVFLISHLHYNLIIEDIVKDEEIWRQGDKKISFSPEIVSLPHSEEGNRDKEKTEGDKPTPSPTPVKRADKGKKPKVERKTPKNGADGSDDIVEQIAQKYGIEIEQMLALVAVESAFNPDACCGTRFAGLVQLASGTARWLGLKVPEYIGSTEPDRDPQVDERFHPIKNLDASMKYLRWLMDRYGNDFTLAIAAYQAGPRKVDRAGGVPDVASTQQHIQKVETCYTIYKSSQKALDAALKRLNAALSNGR